MTRHFWLIMLVLSLTTFMSAVGQKVSQPDFQGKIHYWVKYWNVPAYYVASEPDTGQFWPAVKDKWNGGAYDGHLLFNPEVNDSCAYEDEIYFKLRHLTADVRESLWWISSCNKSFFSDTALWDMVTTAALSREHPKITKAIIQHMIDLKIVTWQAVWTMTHKRAIKAMRTYTQLAFEDHLPELTGSANQAGYSYML